MVHSGMYYRALGKYNKGMCLCLLSSYNIDIWDLSTKVGHIDVKAYQIQSLRYILSNSNPSQSRSKMGCFFWQAKDEPF